MTEQELREKIAITIHFGGLPEIATGFIIGEGDRKDALKFWGDIANQILALIKKNYVRLADDQSLPANIYNDNQYGIAQQDMLNDKYRKVEL